MAKFKLGDRVVWNGGDAICATLVRGRVYEVIGLRYGKARTEVRDTVEPDREWCIEEDSFDLAPCPTREKVLEFIRAHLQRIQDEGWGGDYSTGARHAYAAMAEHLGVEPKVRVELVPLSAD